VLCEKKKTVLFGDLFYLLKLHFSGLALPSAFSGYLILTQENFVLFQICHLLLSLQLKESLLPDVLLPKV